MKNYLLFVNGCVVADFVTYGRALNAFRRRMCRYDGSDMIELVRLPDCYKVAGSR